MIGPVLLSYMRPTSRAGGHPDLVAFKDEIFDVTGLSGCNVSHALNTFRKLCIFSFMDVHVPPAVSEMS